MWKWWVGLREDCQLTESSLIRFLENELEQDEDAVDEEGHHNGYHLKVERNRINVEKAELEWQEVGNHSWGAQEEAQAKNIEAPG